MIPADRWHEPYMTQKQLSAEIGAGVTFWAAENEGVLQGVMGIQSVQDVTLIRHAYVRTSERRNGIGGLLLSHLQTLTDRTILIGNLDRRELGCPLLPEERIPSGSSKPQGQTPTEVLEWTDKAD